LKNVFLSGPYGSHEDLSRLADSLEAEGMEVWRPDHILAGTGTSSIEEILSAIKRCNVFVALLGKPHPNVMFELGYALGGGKAVLLIRESGGQIPFEIASFPVLMTDRLDSRWITEVVARIKQTTVKSKPETPTFQNAHAMLQRMCDDESYLDEVEPREFEECIAKVLQEKGFRAEHLASRNDRGFDVEVHEFLPNVTAVVEVKKQNRNSRLSVTEVQRIVGAAVLARAQHAILITSGGFTASARFFAGESPIRVTLLTIDELFELTRDGLTNRCT
jgi:HJR/Mrr/RecB family endonuclease